MIEITEEQRQRLESGKAIDVVDSQTAQHYVMLGTDVYARIRQLLYDDSDWTQEEMRLNLARAARDNGWDEPAMDAYDRYDEEFKKR